MLQIPGFPINRINEVLSQSGELHRPLDGTRWQVPLRVELRGDRLYWDVHSEKEITGSAGMLESFCRLAEAPPEKILAFARKYGVLHICQHGLPSSHTPDSSDCRPMGWGEWGEDLCCWEPIERWRLFAGQALGLLRVANRLLLGQVGRPEDWRLVYANSGQEAPWWSQTGEADNLLAVEKILFAQCINEWLKLGAARPYFEWEFGKKKPIIKFGSGGLFGALAYQVTLAAGQAVGSAFCTHCAKEYPTARRPKAGQRHFCQACREAGVPTRYSVADHRARVRASAKKKRK